MSRKPPVQAPGHTGRLDVPGPVRAYLQETLGQIDQLAGDPAGLWQIGQRGLQMEAAGKILAGRAFVELRESLPSGEFASGLAERQIPRSSAYLAIDAWTLFAALPDLRCVQTFGQLGVTKALALRHLSPDEQVALADGKPVRGVTLDQLGEMSVRDLQQQQRDWQLAHDDAIQKLERTNAQLKTQLEIVTNQRNKLSRAGAALQAEEDLPHFALVVRQEFLALTEQMSFALDNLQAIADEHLFADIKHPERHRYQPVAAGTALFALQGIHARTYALLQRIQSEFGDVIGALHLGHQLTAAEIKRFQEQRTQLLAQHQAAAKARENHRENQRPGKRGPKRK